MAASSNTGLTPAQLTKARAAARLITRFAKGHSGARQVLSADDGTGLVAAHLNRLHDALHPNDET